MYQWKGEGEYDQEEEGAGEEDGGDAGHGGRVDPLHRQAEIKSSVTFAPKDGSSLFQGFALGRAFARGGAVGVAVSGLAPAYPVAVTWCMAIRERHAVWSGQKK